MPDEAV